MDVLSNGLEAVEVFDFVHCVACSLNVIGVNNDAVALVAVADGNELAVSVFEVEVFGLELFCDSCVGEVESILVPILNALLVADYEQCRRIGLIHFSGKGLSVCTRSSGNDLNVYALSFLVLLSKALEGLVELGLEVQPVNRTLATVGL